MGQEGDSNIKEVDPNTSTSFASNGVQQPLASESFDSVHLSGITVSSNILEEEALIEYHNDRTRMFIIKFLLWMFGIYSAVCLSIWGGLAFWEISNGKAIGVYTKDFEGIIGIFLTPLIGLVSAATGYYYGQKPKN